MIRNHLARSAALSGESGLPGICLPGAEARP